MFGYVQNRTPIFRFIFGWIFPLMWAWTRFAATTLSLSLSLSSLNTESLSWVSPLAEVHWWIASPKTKSKTIEKSKKQLKNSLCIQAPLCDFQNDPFRVFYSKRQFFSRIIDNYFLVRMAEVQASHSRLSEAQEAGTLFWCPQLKMRIRGLNHPASSRLFRPVIPPQKSIKSPVRKIPVWLMITGNNNVF